MTKTSVSRNALELDYLRDEIREVAGFKDKTLSPNDFKLLEQYIKAKYPQSAITSKTLKRFFGYDKTDGNSLVRLYTLDVLSQYVGYANWDDYIEHVSLNANGNSGDFKGEEISADNLQIGDTLQISWQPDRRSILKYLGNQRFEIIETENSKWQVGDTFECKHFLYGKTLCVDNLTGKDGVIKSKTFQVGKKGGIAFSAILS